MSETISYPKTYAYGPVAKILWGTLSTGFIALGIAALIFSHRMFPPPAPVWVGPAGFLFLVLIGIGGLPATFRGKLVLFAERLEYQGLSATKRIARSEIERTERPVRQYGQFYITLVLKNRRNVRICDFGKMDSVLADWLDTLPNAEAEAEASRQERLLANPAFGATPKERERRINREAQLISYANYVGWGIGLWAFVHPRPYNICLLSLIAVPGMALLLLIFGRRRWVLNEDSESGRLALTQIVFLPVLALFLRVFLDEDLLYWWSPLLTVAVVATLLVLLVSRIEKRFNPKVLWAAAIMYAIYSWGALVYLNEYLDHVKPRTMTAQILDMSVSTGKTTTYSLSLTAWGPYRGGDEVTVTSQLYNHVHKGDRVCVDLYPGRFGWQYYYVNICPAANAQPAPPDS